MTTRVKFDGVGVCANVVASPEQVLSILQESYFSGMGHSMLICYLTRRYSVVFSSYDTNVTDCYETADVLRITKDNTVYYNNNNIGNLKQANLKNNIGKIVRFTYNKGSNPGGQRIVKITSETKTHLYGVDLEREEKRTYFKANISGQIELLN